MCLECVFGFNDSSRWSTVFFKRARGRLVEQDSQESILLNLVGVRWRLAPRAARHLFWLQTFTNVSQHEVCRAYSSHVRSSHTRFVQGDTKKRELLENPTKIEEIQEKKLLTEIEPLKLVF